MRAVLICQLTVAVACLAVRTPSQVQPGHVIFSGGSCSMCDPPTQRNGMFLSTPNGQISQIDGFSVLYPLLHDGVDGTLWQGRAGGITRITMSGSVITRNDPLTTLPQPGFVSGMSFDEDGHLLVSGGTYGGTYGLFRVHRQTGVITTLQTMGGVPGLIPGMIEVTPDQQKAYWVWSPPFSLDIVHELIAPFTAPPRQISTIVTPRGGRVTGMAFRPNAQDGEIYFSVDDYLNSVARLDLRTLTFTSFPTVAQGFNPFLDIQYEARLDRFWVLNGGIGTDYLHIVQPNGTLTQVTNLGYIGTPAGLAVNGMVLGTLHVAPMNIPAGAFLLEAGVWGRPGELGILAITRPVPVILATGTINQAGVLAVKVPIPGGALAPGRPRSLDIMGASVNLQTLQVLTTPVTPWPRN